MDTRAPAPRAELTTFLGLTFATGGVFYGLIIAGVEEFRHSERRSSFRAERGIAGFPVEGPVIPSGAGAERPRSRGIAVVPIEGPLDREDCDSSLLLGMTSAARNDHNR